MLIFNPSYRPTGYPPSNQFPAFYKDRKVNVEGSIGQDGRQAMIDRKGGSSQLLAARAPKRIKRQNYVRLLIRLRRLTAEIPPGVVPIETLQSAGRGCRHA